MAVDRRHCMSCSWAALPNISQWLIVDNTQHLLWHTDPQSLPQIFQCFNPPLLVFKPMSPMYLKNISPSVSFINLNCEWKGRPHKAWCSLPAHRAKPFLTQNITVFSSWSGWLILKSPSNHSKSSSVAMITLAFLIEMPTLWLTLAFIVLSKVNLRSLKSGSLIILKAKPSHSRWNWMQTIMWYSILPGKSWPLLSSLL